MTCRLCSSELKLLLDLGATALANEIWDDPSKPQATFPLRVGQCVRCDHVQLMDSIPPARLFPPDYPYRSGTTETFRKYLADFARSIAPPLDEEHAFGLIVDIGSNDGSLLKAFRELGYAGLLGVDPATRAAQDANRLGISTMIRAFDPYVAMDIQRVFGSAQLITALNVMAHTDDLLGFVLGVVNLLSAAHDALFVFEVGYAPRQFARGDIGIVYFEHTSFHHLTPLIPFFLQHGLSLYDAEETPSQGGSIRGYVKRGLHPMTPRLIELLCAEESFDAQALLERAAGKMFAFGQKIAALHAAGKHIAGYGCPAKLTTVLAAMGLEVPAREVFSRIFDDNPHKLGRYTPGTHIPIVESSELEKEQPDICVLFSYNFRDEIFNKHRGFTGEWLIPI